MNLLLFFLKCDIDTSEVLEAASTKWNFIKFYPGLVGGHCIGVDPYYLTYKAKKIGYQPDVILAGRKINDGMGLFIGQEIIKNLETTYKDIKGSKAIIFGITFKENVSDIRNSRVTDIYDHLKVNGIDALIYDPIANKNDVKKHYGIDLIEFEEIKGADAFIFCVSHNEFKNIDLKSLKEKQNKENPFIFDIKWIFRKEDIEKLGYRYWRV